MYYIVGSHYEEIVPSKLYSVIDTDTLHLERVYGDLLIKLGDKCNIIHKSRIAVMPGNVNWGSLKIEFSHSGFYIGKEWFEVVDLFMNKTTRYTEAIVYKHSGHIIIQLYNEYIGYRSLVIAKEDGTVCATFLVNKDDEAISVIDEKETAKWKLAGIQNLIVR